MYIHMYSPYHNNKVGHGDRNCEHVILRQFMMLLLDFYNKKREKGKMLKKREKN